MKTNLFRAICAMASLFVGLGVSLQAHADVFSSGLLGTPPISTDVYGVTCPIGTHEMRANVDDNGGVDGVRLTLQVINPHRDAITAFTAVDNGLSPTVSLAGGGAGNYLVTISKSQPALTILESEAYSAFMDCFTVSEVPIAGTQAVLVQNQ